MGVNAQEMPKVKAYQQYLENTENEAELKNIFTQNIQQDHARSKLKRNVTFKSRGVTYRINSSALKTLVPSNHEEAGTKIVYCCSSFDKPCIMKAKDTDILILIVTYM